MKENCKEKNKPQVFCKNNARKILDNSCIKRKKRIAHILEDTKENKIICSNSLYDIVPEEKVGFSIMAKYESLGTRNIENIIFARVKSEC